METAKSRNSKLTGEIEITERKVMNSKRIVELSKEIQEIINLSTKELQSLMDEIIPDGVSASMVLGDRLGAWCILNYFLTTRKEMARLQECVRRHKLGLGGESLIDIVIAELDKKENIAKLIEQNPQNL